MHYLGGKHRLGPEIARIIRSKRRNLQSILEPFCGSCAVTQHLYPGSITASDINQSVILMHRAIQKGRWLPPSSISEEEYLDLQENRIASPLLGFVGFGCSWGGKWFGGYARGNDRNYCLESRNLLLRRHKLLKNVIFKRANYKNLNPENCLIYADPPYSRTTDYGDSFDSKTFWDIMRKWSQNNVVVISEYQAPPDFKIVAEFNHFSFQGLSSKPTIERLFQHEKSNESQK